MTVKSMPQAIHPRSILLLLIGLSNLNETSLVQNVVVSRSVEKEHTGSAALGEVVVGHGLASVDVLYPYPDVHVRGQCDDVDLIAFSVHWLDFLFEKSSKMSYYPAPLFAL